MKKYVSSYHKDSTRQRLQCDLAWIKAQFVETLNPLKKQSQVALQSIVLDILPFEFSNCLLSMNEIIKQCWIIFDDKSNLWTNKDKINILKLLKEAARTKLELLLHGPVNLAISNLHEDVKRLKEDNEIPKTNFFGLPSIQRINDEDLK